MSIFDHKTLGLLFVGRDRELLALERYFGDGGQLAAIVGPHGSGKTALAHMFAQWAESTGMFPEGSQRINLWRDLEIDDVLPKSSGGRRLLVLDEFEFAERPLREALQVALERRRNLSALVCANELTQSDLASAFLIRLGGLSRAEFRTLIEARVQLTGHDRQVADRLFELVAGNALYADLAGTTARELVLTLDQVMRGLGEFRRSGILGPDGKPISDVPEHTRIAVVDANAALVEKLRADPATMRQLSSRQFEEVVAELLSQQGYEIELTPLSGDGGFDMFAARREGLGKFLFLVECKRYTPPNKVGVSIVRELHGVVHEKRATAGVLVTSSFFTRGAKDFQERSPYQLKLHDYIALQQWLGILKTEG
jgi:restriction system protein